MVRCHESLCDRYSGLNKSIECSVAAPIIHSPEMKEGGGFTKESVTS